jgi:hypothetical protein
MNTLITKQTTMIAMLVPRATGPACLSALRALCSTRRRGPVGHHVGSLSYRLGSLPTTAISGY